MQETLLKIRALLYFKFNIGLRPLAHPDIENILSHDINSVTSYIDNITYWGGPDAEVRVEYICIIDRGSMEYISLKDKSHYDIVTLFNYVNKNRSLAKTREGFNTNIYMEGTPSGNEDTYPHPFIVKIDTPYKDCRVKPIKYKLFHIDII